MSLTYTGFPREPYGDEMETMDDLIAYNMHMTIRKIAADLLEKDATVIRKAIPYDAPLRSAVMRNVDVYDCHDAVRTCIRSPGRLREEVSEEIVICANDYILKAAEILFTKLYDLAMEDMRSEEEEG